MVGPKERVIDEYITRTNVIVDRSKEKSIQTSEFKLFSITLLTKHWTGRYFSSIGEHDTKYLSSRYTNSSIMPKIQFNQGIPYNKVLSAC